MLIKMTTGRIGSSPRVRGTPLNRYLQGERMRFIPACAGNTPPMPCCQAGFVVHPRVCGEHTRGEGLIGPSDGSSPRVRGTLEHAIQQAAEERFIPACAGNTIVS